MAKYQYDTGKEILTGANNIIRFVIKEWAKEGKRQFTTKEVDERLKNLKGLNILYKDNTGANLHSMCVNSNSAKHYSNSKPDFLYLVGRATFEVYDPEKHGNNVKRMESLLNDLAIINRQREKKEIEETVAETQILARKGQGRFRQDVLAWCPACPVSGVDNKRLLIASHIKPWANSNNEERLDSYNGFMFAPHIDALFDIGYISFDDEGKILISPQLDNKHRQAFNIFPDIHIKGLPEKTREYLKYHRDHIYMSN